MPTTITEVEVIAPVDAELVAYAGKTGLEPASTTPLVDAFRPIFAEARAVLASAAGVAESVRDATCVSEIKQARTCRLAIRKVRLAGEAVRKTQKANALTYGRAVDGFFNILEADLSPVEKALQDAEDTAERAETARKDALEVGRKSALAPFVSDASLYSVREMTDAAFAALLTGVRVAKEQAEAALAKEKADRIAKEQAEAAERERIRLENEKLKQEALAREAAAKAEREAAELKLKQERAEAVRLATEQKAKADAEAKAAQEKAAKERAEIEAKAKAEREELQAKARAEKAAADARAAKERAERERLEAELKAKRDEEAKLLSEQKEVARKAASAGDAEKLVVFAALIDRGTPTLKDQQLEARVQQIVHDCVMELKAEHARLV